jgi:hypothetical protein
MFALRSTLPLLLTIGVVVQAPSARAHDKAVDTTVCEVAKHPTTFDNKLVRIKAKYVGNFEISSIRDPDRDDCNGLSFTYLGGHSLGVSLDVEPTQPRPTVHLKDNEQLHRFQRLLNAKMYPRHEDIFCIDCSRYEVTAIMTGLIEFAGEGLGFGHMNMFSVQFVLQSIEQTSARDLAPKYKASEFSTTPIRFPTGYITGTLIGPDGQPVVNTDVDIYPAIRRDPERKFESRLSYATTDEKGHFRFEVSPGGYILGFNTFWVPSPDVPFPPTYFPSTAERSSARVVTVVDKREVGGLVFKLSQPLVPRTISVRVVWPEGSPVAVANVWLSQVSVPDEVAGPNHGVSHTAADGSYDLVGFEGVDYVLHADKYAGLGRVTCARALVLRGNEPVPSPISLALTITDFSACQKSDYEVPTDSASPN